MVVAAGFSRGNIKYLVDKGMIEKSSRGIYILPEVWDDEIFNLQNRFKRGIYSHETALFLWDLTDRTPNKYHMTFPMNYNLTNPKKENIRCVQCKKEIYDLEIAEAFKRYTANSDKNIPVLSELAKILKVERKLRSYLEVLL